MYLNQEITEQIKARYAVYPRPLNGLSNVLVDSFLPKAYIETMNSIPQEFPKTFKAISEFTARITNTQVIDREQLFRMLGYSKKDITTLLKAVKAKRLSSCFIGLGGTGSNTLYWLKEMCRITNTVNLFKDILVIEPDTLSIDNLLRMPMDTMAIQGETIYPTVKDVVGISYIASNLHDIETKVGNSPYYNKQELIRNYLKRTLTTMTFSDFNKLVIDFKQNNNAISKLKLITPNYNILCTGKIKKFPVYFVPGKEWLTTYNHDTYKYEYAKPFTYSFFYGAPDINTRLALKNKNIPLITATHGDDDCSIHLNPEQDTTLQVESYGVIKLGIFFMNQIRMAIGLLELLASNIDLSSSQEFLSYSYVNNDKTLPTDRTYNLQLEHSGLLEE